MKHNHLTYIKILCNLTIFLASLVLVLWVFPKVLVFFMPFVVAWLISCIATPLIRLVERHLKLKRKLSMVVVVVVIIGIVVTAIYNIGIYLGRLITNFIADLPAMWESIRTASQGMFQIIFELLDKLPKEDITAIESFLSNSGDYIAEMFSSLSEPTISMVGNIAKQVPDIIIYTIMCLIATYFFVVEREEIHQKLHKYIPNSIQHIWRIVKKCFVESVGGYFKAQFKIEIWIYLLLFIGLSILKVKYAIIIALGIAVLDLLPVFGTGAVLWPWALIEFINGRYGAAIGMMLTWGISQLVRQFIQPKFVGDTLGVHPIPTLFLLFAGYKLSGVLGMIIAIPLGILVGTLYHAGVFKKTEQSIWLLAGRIEKLCQYDDKELGEIESYKKQENKS